VDSKWVQAHLRFCRSHAAQFSPDGDGFGATDYLLLVISQFGLKGGSAYINHDGVVGVSDLLTLISDWGPCP